MRIKGFVLSILLGIFSIACQNTKSPDTDKSEPRIKVHCEILYMDYDAQTKVGYTNDLDSLWTNRKWIKAMKDLLMNETSGHYNTVILFDSKEHTPDISTLGFNSYPLSYDKYMVCAYWIFPTGRTQFAYGGVNSNGNWKYSK